MFLKWLKKNKIKILTYTFCAFAMALFTIISFTCKTYAYTIDGNGNLVGDNLLPITTNTINQNVAVDLIPDTYTINFNVIESNNITIQIYSSYSHSNIVFINSSVGHKEATFTIDNNTRITLVPNGSTLSYVMLNKGTTALPWEPYGVWYSENNYNAIVEDNEELIEMINTKNTKELQSGIKANLQGTQLKVYNQNHMELSNMLTTNPIFEEEIIFTEEQLNYDMYINNTNVYNGIINNNGEFINGQQLTTDYPTLLYTFKTPLYIQALTFSRGDTTGTRYINIYFSDNSSTELLLSEGSDLNRSDITWTNDTNKYVTYISTTAEVGYNVVGQFTIPNSSQIYTSGYEQGYTDGWYESFKSVSDKIENVNQNLQAKYNEGYNEGYEKGSNTNNTLYNMIIAVADTPITIFKQIFNFNILGLDISGFIFGIISLIIIIWLIKKLI